MWRLVLAVGLFLGLVLPFPAWACSCMPSGRVYPQGGTVPPNVTFHASHTRSQRLVLRENRGGGRVPLHVEEIGDDILRIRPSTPLQAGKRYTLEEDPELSKGSGYKPEPLSVFEVQGEPDTQPPRPPGTVDSDYEHRIANRSTSCESEEEGYTLTAKGASDDRVLSDKLATVVVSESAPERILALLPPGEDFIGSTTCFDNFDVNKARGTRVVLRSLDLAGNLSAPSAVLTLAKGTPRWVAAFVQTLPSKVVISIILGGLLWILVSAARRNRSTVRSR
jgi:hypothetical protein